MQGEVVEALDRWVGLKVEMGDLFSVVDVDVPGVGGEVRLGWVRVIWPGRELDVMLEVILRSFLMLLF